MRKINLAKIFLNVKSNVLDIIWIAYPDSIAVKFLY